MKNELLPLTADSGNSLKKWAKPELELISKDAITVGPALSPEGVQTGGGHNLSSRGGVPS